MKLMFPWGKESLSVSVPDTWKIIHPEPLGKPKKAGMDELKVVRDALKNPYNAQPLNKLNLRGKKVLIVVDDNTRPTPAHRFFHLVLDTLVKAGANPKNILLMPALGIHTPMTDAEMAEKVGVKNLKKIPWENHSAFDKEKNHYFGKTRRGTPVWLNRRLAEADLAVILGMVEPHLWAGFGGGLKNLLPGIAYAETIGLHHGILAEPPYLFNRVGMVPELNTFRTDLEDIKDLIKIPVFCLNVVIDHRKKVLAAFAGDPVVCHREAVLYNNQVSGRKLREKVDAVVVNSNPMDINFKQSMKCVGNSLPALKPGGTVIGFLRAERGLDDIIPPEDSKPLWLVKTILRILGPSRVMGFLEKVKKGLNVEEKFLMYYSMQLMRQYDLYFYVPTLPSEQVKKLGFFVHSYDPQEIVDKAARKLGSNAVVAVFPEGGATFPIVG